MKDQIFISYQRDDEEVAKNLYRDLLSEGYPVWMDPAIKPVELWRPQIENKLRESKRFIALLTSNSVKSKWVLHEGSMAHGLGQKIIPLQVSDFDMNKYMPVWAEEVQLANFKEMNTDYKNHFILLKQLLGEPVAIQTLLDEMVRNHETTGALLDEIALSLIERHMDEGKIIVSAKAKELIAESQRKLQQYYQELDLLQQRLELKVVEGENLIRHIKNNELRKKQLRKSCSEKEKTFQEKTDLHLLFVFAFFLINLYWVVLSLWLTIK